MGLSKRVIILTGGELRHEFLRKFLSIQQGVNVVASFCEPDKKSIIDIVETDINPNQLRKKHLAAREITEHDFFGVFCSHIRDASNPINLEKGEINSKEVVQRIVELNPDILISYGCSIIRSELLSIFRGKFINIHLGLSPYYRGSGTNFWPFVNNELQFLGVTFMHIDEGIDTGEIIHQIRARISFNDNIHQIGNRLIRDACNVCAKLILSHDSLDRMTQISIDQKDVRVYRKRDFTEESLKKAYENISKGVVEDYLRNEHRLTQEYPIITNPNILEI